MLEQIPTSYLFMAAGAIGAAVRGGISFYQTKKENKKMTFDLAIFGDTLVEGAIAGIGFAVGMPLNVISIIGVALCGAGIDSYTNKLGIQILPKIKEIAIKYKKKK